MLEITSNKNPLIKEVKSLYKKKERMKSNSFIIEGIKIIEEAIKYKYPLKSIIYTDRLTSTLEGEDFLHRIRDRVNLIYVGENIFREISDTENPQGILGIASFEQKGIRTINLEANPSLLFLDSLQDPGNMGTIIRTGDAFNIDGIIIGPGSVDPYNPKVVRATMGSIFRVPLYYSSRPLDELKELKDKGIKVYSTSLDNSVILEKTDFRKAFILIIGNESKGVEQKLLHLSDKMLKIPMPGHAESLNAGVAASIIMYEVMKQRSNTLEF